MQFGPCMGEQKILVATFSDYSAAQTAARELEQNGVSADSIHVDSNRKTAGAGSPFEAGEQTHREGAFTRWWHSLFGEERHREDRTRYEGTLSSGGALLRATVPAELADSAAEILNRSGAAEVENESARKMEQVEGEKGVRRGGVWVYSQSGAEEGSVAKTGGLSPTVPTPGVLSPSLGTAGTGTPAGQGLTSAGPDISSDAAYRFGERIAADPRYKGRGWDEVETDVRNEFHALSPGNAWEKSKGSVRAGWDRMTSSH